MRKLPFYHLVEGAVLHHHDRADGMGAMRVRAEDTPLCAQLIHIADRADFTFKLDSVDRGKYAALMNWARAHSGDMFSPDCVRFFAEAVDYELLHRIAGMEDIARWASFHHEKLDGSGYPFGLKAEQLGKKERLMACIDVYQALVEERPYKPGLPHEDAMRILRRMGRAGQLDPDIIEDIDACRNLHGGADVSGRAPEREQSDTGPAWRCPVCGFVFEGVLPDGMACPQCGQPGSSFERI